MRELICNKLAQNGTRMHKLRPRKPKFFWGRTPRPPCSKMYCLGVILQTSMPPFWSPNIYILSITTLADIKFTKIVEFTPQWSPPNVTYFRQSDLKYTKNDLKLAKNDLKYYDLKWDFLLGGLVLCMYSFCIPLVITFCLVQTLLDLDPTYQACFPVWLMSN